METKESLSNNSLVEDFERDWTPSGLRKRLNFSNKRSRGGVHLQSREEANAAEAASEVVVVPVQQEWGFSTAPLKALWNLAQAFFARDPALIN